MKKVTMFITDWCPHCKRAKGWVEEIKIEHPEYRDIEVTIIDEEKQPEIAKQHDYYYVPTYYIEDNKIYEGATSKEALLKVFEEASKSP